MADSLAAQGQFTRAMCAYFASLRFEDLPARTVHEARRGVLDWLGCAVAGSTHPTVDKLIELLLETGGRSQATVVGRRSRLGWLDAPVVNGAMAHVLDYDDTYMTGTVLHASAPILAALFALAEREGCDGRRLLLSYVVGFEAAVRVARALPDHHKGGWHATGTLGTLAAGVAAARMLDLDAGKMSHALGIAATQSAGLLENRDSACKALHAGKAGANGLLSALLASKGIDSSESALEGNEGFCRAYGSVCMPEALSQSLGERWAIEGNGHKPFPCAIGLHPVIEAIISLRAAESFDVQQVERVELRVNPYLGRYRKLDDPVSGHHAKFSVYHSAAVALLDGKAGVGQFTDARASDPAVLGLSRKVSVTMDQSLATDQAYACISTSRGKWENKVEHAAGTVSNPMTDQALQLKFEANVEMLGRPVARRASELAWALEGQDGVDELMSLVA